MSVRIEAHEAEAKSPRPSGLHGLIAIDKPMGLTSHDVVERARKRLASPGAGHLGTLDPMATGLLIVALGAATRCAAVWQGGAKTYEGRLRLGVITDSQDTTGRVLAERAVAVDEAALRSAGDAMVGTIDQIPPMVAAIRVQGERLYKRARRGEVVERAARRVSVTSWSFGSISIPEAEFRVSCSGGTYVRTLVHDLGQRLGCGAALSSLKRLRSEPFGLEGALSWRDLNELPAGEAWARAGVPLERALAPLPHLVVSPSEADAVGHGGVVTRAMTEVTDLPLAAGPRSIVIAALDGTPLGLGDLTPAPEGGDRLRISPHLVFPWAVREGRS